MRRVVVYSGTRNVYGDILTSMRSLLDHTKVDTVYLLIEDDEFSKPLPDVCRVINVSQQAYFKEKTPNYNSRWSYMALMKVALPDLLANEDIALHLDIDTVVVDDISDLWEIDISKYYFAAVREPLKSAPDFVYCNVGACLLNLKKMRESEIFKTMISELNVYYYPFPDEEIGLIRREYQKNGLPLKIYVNDIRDENENTYSAHKQPQDKLSYKPHSYSDYKEKPATNHFEGNWWQGNAEEEKPLTQAQINRRTFGNKKNTRHSYKENSISASQEKEVSFDVEKAEKIANDGTIDFGNMKIKKRRT